MPTPGERWAMWRQDDNGNRFMVEIVEGKAAADQRLSKLEKSIHTQYYWAVPVSLD